MSANRIRESLHETFIELLSQISSGSNIDQRYLKACDNLLKYLSTPLELSSIEAFGLNYQLVHRMTKRLADETGGVIIDQIEHTLVGISVLLNQFQEWKDYMEALSISRIDIGDSSELVKCASRLADDLSNEPNLIDKRISDKIKEMIEPVLSGAINADTIAVPLTGSISNIFNELSRVAIEYVPTLQGASVATGLATTVILANFSITLLNNYCPIISQFHPLKFIIEVQQYIHKHYSILKDALKIGGN